MKGRLKKIDDKWVIEYSGVSYKGGNPKQLGNYTKKVEKKTLPLHPNFVTMTDYVWVKGIKVYDGDVVKFTEVLVNPMGREVDPKDLSQNHSKCVWYVRPYLDEEKDLIMEVPMAQYPKDETKKLFTDYPITELGDEEFKEAPIRECELLFYDDNKYCYVKVGGIEKEIKRAYIYTKSGRCGEVDCISIDEINKLIEVNEQKQHLIDMMKSDEELGLYEQIDQNNPVTKGSTALVKEIKLEDIFNDEKREGSKRVIHQHKVLKELTLINPSHLEMTSNGHGEFPDGYKLTHKGIQYIINQLNKE